MAAGTMKTTFFLVPAAGIVAAAVTLYHHSGRSGARELPPVPAATVPLPPDAPPTLAVADLALPPVVTAPSVHILPVSAPAAPVARPPEPAAVLPAIPTVPAAPATPIAAPNTLPKNPGALPAIPAAPSAFPAIPPGQPVTPAAPVTAPAQPVASVTPPAAIAKVVPGNLPQPPGTVAAVSSIGNLPPAAPVAAVPVAPVGVTPAPAPPAPAVPVPPVPQAVPVAKTPAPVTPTIPPTPAVPVLVEPEGAPPKQPAAAPQPTQVLPQPAPLPVPTPVPQPAPVTPATPESPAAPGEKFVVLKGNKLTEGSVTVAGEKAVLRQGSFERALPKGDVLFVGDTKDDVYKFMLAQVPPTDAAARMSVAKWCMFSGLREQALAEAREVLKLQPANTAAKSMVHSLEESLRNFPVGGSPVVAAKPAGGGVLVSEERDPEVTAEGATSFSARAQPVLANQCMECHARADYAGAFKLIRITGFEVGPQSTKSNLLATSAQINRADPMNSPLLTKALAAHGGMKQPAFVSRQSAGFRVLEAWVATAALPLTQPMAQPAQPVLPPDPIASVPPMPQPTPPPAAAVLPPADVPAIPPAEPLLPPPAPSAPAPVKPVKRPVQTLPVPEPTPAVEPLLPPVPAVEPGLPGLPAPAPVPQPTEPATNLPTLPAPGRVLPSPSVPEPSIPAVPNATVPLPVPEAETPVIPAPAVPVPVAPRPSEPATKEQLLPPVPEVGVPPVLPTPSSIPSVEPKAQPVAPLPAIPAPPVLPAPPAAPGVPDLALPKPQSQFGASAPQKPAKSGPTGGDEFDPAAFNKSK
jgi:hypothetical protein